MSDFLINLDQCMNLAPCYNRNTGFMPTSAPSPCCVIPMFLSFQHCQSCCPQAAVLIPKKVKVTEGRTELRLSMAKQSGINLNWSQSNIQTNVRTTNNLLSYFRTTYS